MAEDSGAFKTNPRNSAQFGHFINAGLARGDSTSFYSENAFEVFPAFAPPICNERREPVALFSDHLIRAVSRSRPVL
jgi:hypothetical protein